MSGHRAAVKAVSQGDTGSCLGSLLVDLNRIFSDVNTVLPVLICSLRFYYILVKFTDVRSHFQAHNIHI